MIKKIMLFTIILMSLSLNAFADSNVTFVWNPNSEVDLKGYKLYQSDVSGVYNTDIPIATIPAGTETANVIIKDGIWFWVLTAYDNYDNESGFSNEVTEDFNTSRPAPPGGLGVTVFVRVEVETN